jgi:hypothetical protein
MSTWARKPGQTPGQAQADAKQSSAYNYTPNRQPGQAQPQASPYSTATPYGQSAVNMQSYAGTSPYGQAPQAPTSRTDGNWANYASNQRPAPFTASYGNPFGGRAAQPDFSQRDAFIQSLNNQATPYMAGQQRGPIQYDVNAAMNSAQGMLQGGFQNPFVQTLAQQSFPPQYQALMLPQSANPSQPSWVDVPGYGFDQQGNQVPGGASRTPPGATRSPYDQEIERMKDQGRYGRTLPITEQAIADAVNRSPANRADLERARESMQRPRPTQRFNPNASQMVAGMVQSTGATGYGAGLPGGAVGYTDQRFQLPNAAGRRRGLVPPTGRAPVYV